MANLEMIASIKTEFSASQIHEMELEVIIAKIDKEIENLPGIKGFSLEARIMRSEYKSALNVKRMRAHLELLNIKNNRG